VPTATGDAGRVITIAGMVERGLHEVGERQGPREPYPFPQVLPK
jgi:hypothetical protein